MRPSLQKVKTLEAQLMGLEMELKLMGNDLGIVRYNISQLEVMERTFTYNMKFLKKKKVIAVASEYKKTVEELQRIQESLITYRNLEKDLLNKIDTGQGLHEKFMAEYEVAKTQIENEKVILVFDPRKKKRKNEGPKRNKKEDT